MIIKKELQAGHIRRTYCSLTIIVDIDLKKGWQITTGKINSKRNAKKMGAARALEAQRDIKVMYPTGEKRKDVVMKAGIQTDKKRSVGGRAAAASRAVSGNDCDAPQLPPTSSGRVRARACLPILRPVVQLHARQRR